MKDKIKVFIFLKNRFLSKIVYRFGKFQFFLLSRSADLLIRFSRLIGRFYTSIWSLQGISWFDHRFDYLRGIDNIFWLERAFFVNRVIKKNSSVLDIGCGDGIFSGLFYSAVAKEVLAIDLDSRAISHAKRYYNRSNVTFINRNILKWEPKDKKFDLILLFAVIEHFSKRDGLLLLEKIRKMMKPDGLLMGSTPVFSDKGYHNMEHKNEFSSVKDLNKFLGIKFKRVKTYTSNWPGRLECYFECRN
ncbi:class I SAM-dependent methyltransferase [Patescibacteria group bacterium]|nr:class I SAM-dependent methyltransferase [Patescibacteria group bacterium]